jgi:hypothetical protein
MFFSTCCKLEACFPVRLDPILFESNDSAYNNRSSRVREISSASACKPLMRSLAMYLGFVLANPDWYETEEYDGSANI